MLNKHYTNKIIFLNIETVPQKSKFEELSSAAKDLFTKRFKSDIKEAWPNVPNGIPPEDAVKIYEHVYQEKAPLSAEWGRIACISLLVMNDKGEYGIKSFTDHNDEKKLLEVFLLTSPSISGWKRSSDSKVVCSYNGFGFTFPFIAKRFLLNGLSIPAMFDYSEAKPWEQDQFISLMDVWSFNKSSYTSLDTLAHCLGVEFVDGGKDVYSTFYSFNDEVMKSYSQSRVVTLTNCYLKIKQQPILTKK